MGPVKIILLWAGDSSNQFYYLLPKDFHNKQGPLYNLVVLQISHLLKKKKKKKKINNNNNNNNKTN